MEGNATGKPFKLPGHTLPGINQRSEGDTDLPDGRSASAALQYKSPLYNKEPKNMTKIDPKDLGKLQKPAEGYEWVMLNGKPSQVKSPTTYASPAKKPEDLLVGNRKNLPEHLQAKISAAPYASPAKDTSPHTGMNPPHTEENHSKKYLAKKGTIRKKTPRLGRKETITKK